MSSTKTAARFLRTTSREAQGCIRHLELEHEMYNEPRLTEHRVFKLRSDAAWRRVCEDMAGAFSGLRVLHVQLSIWDWPIRLTVGEGWSVPLLFFGREGKGMMDFVAVRLKMSMFGEKRLAEVARGLEERMMDPVKFQIREDERVARELAGPVKTRVLKLVI